MIHGNFDPAAVTFHFTYNQYALPSSALPLLYVSVQAAITTLDNVINVKVINFHMIGKPVPLHCLHLFHHSNSNKNNYLI